MLSIFEFFIHVEVLIDTYQIQGTKTEIFFVVKLVITFLFSAIFVMSKPLASSLLLIAQVSIQPTQFNVRGIGNKLLLFYLLCDNVLKTLLLSPLHAHTSLKTEFTLNDYDLRV